MTDTTTAQALTDEQCELIAGGNRNFVATTMATGEEEPGCGLLVATTMATGEEEPKRRQPIALDAHLHR